MLEGIKGRDCNSLTEIIIEDHSQIHSDVFEGIPNGVIITTIISPAHIAIQIRFPPGVHLVQNATQNEDWFGLFLMGLISPRPKLSCLILFGVTTPKVVP